MKAGHGSFSGKQKKQILQARRKRIENKKSGKADDLHSSSAPQVAVEVEVNRKNPTVGGNQRGVQLIREIFGLRTVFAREPDDVVHERRRRAQTEPIDVLSARSLWEQEDLAPLHVLGMPQRLFAWFILML